MGAYLYMLCEGVSDELFYERVAERVTDESFDLDGEFRQRRGADFKTTMRLARILLKRIQGWREPQEIRVILAVDNDRAPNHPGAVEPEIPRLPKDAKKEPRLQRLHSLVNDYLGPDSGTRPVKVAVAVPVEMLESWALPLLDPEITDPPLFARASHPAARKYYGAALKPQLKDLLDALARQRRLPPAECILDAADQGDLETLESRSKSFALFAQELRSWSAEETN